MSALVVKGRPAASLLIVISPVYEQNADDILYVFMDLLYHGQIL